MAMTITKTINLNGTSQDDTKALANFYANINSNGTLNINENILVTMSESQKAIEEADFKEFREFVNEEANK